MIARRVSESDMLLALRKVNKLYKDNIVFRRLDRLTDSQNPIGSFGFTLTVKSSRSPGGRFSASSLVDGRNKPRHIAAACWHVHGHFFDALFAIAPDARILTTGGKRRAMTVLSGNWQDYNIGSQAYPCMASEACECNN